MTLDPLRLLCVDDVAAILRCSRGAVHQLISRGVLRVAARGPRRRPLMTPEDVTAYLTRHGADLLGGEPGREAGRDRRGRAHVEGRLRMTMQGLIDAMNKASARRKAEGGAMTLGDLRSALASAPPDMPVRFDDGRFPSSIDSYRGSYCEPTLTPDGKSAPAAADVLRWVDDALGGQVFYGYKGGEYTYSEGDPVNVASYGEAWAPEAIGFAIEDGHIVIKTRPHQDSW